MAMHPTPLIGLAMPVFKHRIKSYFIIAAHGIIIPG
jgi:hypothetical protein